MAGWQSGYAAACKAVNAGSIPTPASIHQIRLTLGVIVSFYHNYPFLVCEFFDP